MNEATAAVLAALAPLATRLAVDAYDGKFGTPEDAARAVLDLGLSLVPRSELIAYLSEEGRLAGELAADILENEKFTKP